MDVTAPHLVRAAADAHARQRRDDARPHRDDVGRPPAPATCCAAPPAPRTRTLPRPRRLNATETLSLAPSLRADTLRGGLLAWDGQLEDDARLVVTVARTAASYGAEVRTRARVTSATGTGVELRDELTGADVRRPRPRRRQRDRRLGRRPRRPGPAAAQPRHPPRAARLDAAAHPGGGDGADPGHHVPLRDGAAPARRHPLRRAHRRAGHRPDARRAGAERGGDRLPARRRRLRLHRPADPRRRGRRLRRAPAAARGGRAPTRPPTCRAATRSSPRRPA